MVPKEHGVFHELATVEQGDQPCACPICQTLSPRVILIPPEILAMAPARKKAMERNEKVAHEPRLFVPESMEEVRERKKAARHGGGCGCHSHDDPGIRKSQVFYTADGSKIFPTARPWMISH